MKKLSIIAAITLGSLVTFNTTLQAAEKAESAPAANSAQTRGANRADRLATMKKELNLTDQQVAKLKPIFEAETKKMQEMRQDTNLSREDRRAKYTKMREESQLKLKTILTADQMKKWEELRKTAMQRRQRTQQ